MPIWSSSFSFKTEKEGDLILLDNLISEIIKNSGLETGIVTLFVPGSTGALTTIEYEKGLKKDFPSILENIIPKNFNYMHNRINFDDNGHSHVRASIIGPSLTIPFRNKELLLGTWQQIVFVELDTRNRSRKIEVMIIAD